MAHRVFVRRYRHLVSSVLLESSASTPAVLQPLTSAIGRPDADDEAITIQQDLRRWIGGNAEHRHYVMRLLREERPKELAALSPMNATAREQRADTSRDKLLYSARGGLVLLIPAIVSLRLHNCFTMAQLRGALWTAGGDEEHEVPAEAWLRTLLPDLPQSLPDGTLPAAWRLGLAAQRQHDIERLMHSGNVELMLAKLLLAQFAARLSGLQGSSDAYLRSQFLHHSGYFVIDETQIVARLDSVPLFIVLRMAGLAGWSDQLPWLQRPLTIEITQ
ncbi:MAG: hypothetical protein ACRER5_24425 [Pseudomonas sp.]